jgi:hypothetical protein
MKTNLIAIALIASLVMASCGGGENSTLTEGLSALNKELDSISKAEEEKKNAPAVAIDWTKLSDSTLHETNVELIGYVALPGTSYQSSTAQIGLYERPAQFQATESFIVTVDVGTGNNTMVTLPEKYKEEDLKITGNKGEAITAGDRVKITGRFSNKYGYYSLDCKSIEKLEAAPVDYGTLNATKLTSTNIKDTTLFGKLVMAEGVFEMPMMTMSGAYTFVYLKKAGLGDDFMVNIQYGSKPGQLGPLPDNYTDADVKIMGADGTPINFKKKVRVYGVFKNDAIYVEHVRNL